MRLYLILITLFLFGGCAIKHPITLEKKLQIQTLPDIKLHYISEGSGDDLILIHGFGSSSASFKKIMPDLAKRFHIYALDLKGFGKSPKPRDGNYSIYDQYLVVKKFIIDHHIKNPIILGHSIGGAVALLLAIDDEIDVKKLVLLDTPAYKQDLPKLLRYANIPFFGTLGFNLLSAHYEVMEGYRYAFYDDNKIPQDIVDELTNDLRSKNAKYAFLEANRAMIPDDIKELNKQYKKITIPTLIVWGNEDIVIRKSKAFKLHQDLPNSTLKMIYHCGHLPQEEKPKELLKILDEFL